METSAAKLVYGHLSADSYSVDRKDLEFLKEESEDVPLFTYGAESDVLMLGMFFGFFEELFRWSILYAYTTVPVTYDASGNFVSADMD